MKKVTITKPIGYYMDISICAQVGVYNRDLHYAEDRHGLGLEGYGRTEESALSALFEDFIACIDMIVMEEDEKLSVDAKELKEKMLTFINIHARMAEFPRRRKENEQSI